ncbi:AAR170Wp [Eremothecium gossypii ATCC 10895]|uniref:AAR170Wp n=1 Tax=Eremothecium gossypii (strain ATCC 10895 / CBS 109.51 / FGSC 9923 / NRRL Y-1056) TaxID=284811 RepID=Q75EA7_EREGS|nr:AAR170Wp [Eremothecium gossypii ATCC 10895]AAS50537.2 AAR170Wp [Eremothecium gossypii ATCC 10895]
MRISQKLKQRAGAADEEQPKASFSFEFFVPKTLQGVQNLYDRMDRMYQTQPEFIDITWNAGGRLSQRTSELVATSQGVLGLETCMHLTCTNMSTALVDEALERAYEAGCENILALRGDPPLQGTWEPCAGGFRYAKDLVAHIRARYGDHFDVGVAGYPEGHEEASGAELIGYLKEKVDAGADFIITQMFYDADLFLKWCDAVRAAGISVPIIPGIMPITSYAALLRRAKWCQVRLPPEFLERLEPVKDDDQAVREIGTVLVADMCRKILASGHVTHLHLYTMNLERASLMILERLQLIDTGGAGVRRRPSTNETLPWRKSLNPTRRKEGVRPIFWQRRPYSYVARTSQWSADEFPNGRFGDSSSPAYGDLDLCGHTVLRQTYQRSLELWSTPRTLLDLAALVISYLKGDLKCLPWSDVPLHQEADALLDSLIRLNEHLVLTINSQPKVNGAPSADPIVGWGPANGYVYQKQYLEFLLPKHHLPAFHAALTADFPTLTYFAVDADDNLASNHPDDTQANAVTWGIFPGREVLQPTIVEKASFLAWKDEFYRILDDWRLSFDENGAADSAALLAHLTSDYALVNIVDNDFVATADNIYCLLARFF